jgi:hypothetical protein
MAFDELPDNLKDIGQSKDQLFLSLNGAKTCPCCGASLKMFWHTLTPGLVRVLIKFHEVVRTANRNDVEPSKEMQLSKSEYNNFQKLRFHALVAKVKKGGRHTTGHWLLTQRGREFLYGRASVPARVKTFRNQVIEHDTNLVTIRDIMQSGLPQFEQIEDFKYEVARLDLGVTSRARI